MTEVGSFFLGDRQVRRLGYGAMQLAGPGVLGPPADRAEALAVLREAVERGVNHIDTSDYYGPHVTNRLICEALCPYPKDLVIVTKVGARRGTDGAWHAAMSADDLLSAVQDNLRNLQLDALDVVNLRMMFDEYRPSEGSIEPALTALAELQQRGLIRNIGLSHVTRAQVTEGRQICKIVCVQNHYNVVHRDDDPLIDELRHARIAFVPYFPLGGFTQLDSHTLQEAATRMDATPMQVALAWLLHRSENILPIPGTSSRIHLRENLHAGELSLPPDIAATLDAMGNKTGSA